MNGLYTILLLILSNIFMTLAWYGHLKLSESGISSNWPLLGIIAFSWGIAFFEYCCQVPANRLGFIGNAEQDKLFKRLNERFIRAFATYRLLEDNDHVLIGLSGGKDSLLLTELLAKRARINHPQFKVEAVHVRMENITYETSTDYLQQFCSSLNVPLHLVTTSFSSDPSPFTTHPSPCLRTHKTTKKVSLIN